MSPDIFPGFIKIHILHHASKAKICGVEMMAELKRHGYGISPGTLYPTLHSLETKGYLRSEEVVERGRMRKYYCITGSGEKMLAEAREKVRELVEEVLE